MSVEEDVPKVEDVLDRMLGLAYDPVSNEDCKREIMVDAMMEFVPSEWRPFLVALMAINENLDEILMAIRELGEKE